MFWCIHIEFVTLALPMYLGGIRGRWLEPKQMASFLALGCQGGTQGRDSTVQVMAGWCGELEKKGGRSWDLVLEYLPPFRD